MTDKHFEIQKLRITMTRASDQMKQEILRMRETLPENCWPREEKAITAKYDNLIRGSAARINALAIGQ